MNLLDVINNQQPAEVNVIYRDVRLTFGKYKGRFAFDVLELDPEYLEWCIDNTSNKFDDSFKGEILAAASERRRDLDIDEQEYFGGPQEGDLPF